MNTPSGRVMSLRDLQQMRDLAVDAIKKYEAELAAEETGSPLEELIKRCQMATVLHCRVAVGDAFYPLIDAELDILAANIGSRTTTQEDK